MRVERKPGDGYQCVNECEHPPAVAVRYVNQFCVPFIFGHDFYLVIDGGEMYVGMGEKMSFF